MTDPSVLLPYRREHPRPFDPADELRRLRAEEPVCRQQAPNGEWMWLVTRRGCVPGALRPELQQRAPPRP